MAVPPHSHAIANDKQRMRVELRARRAAFAAERTFIDDACTAPHLAPLTDLIATASVVAGYWPIGGEADVRPLLSLARARGKIVVLPRFDRDTGVMQFHLSGDALQLETRQGYVMPALDAPVVEPDLILAPLIGFDRTLNRLGQGGGYYDRSFAQNGASHKVGIAWSVQEVDRIPVEPHDRPLDAILTEREWITR